MICPKCKKQIDNDSQFCEFCGEQIKVTNSQSKNNKVGLFWGVIVVLFISVCASLFYIFQLGIDIDVLKNNLNNSIERNSELNNQLIELRNELNETEDKIKLVNTVIISAKMMDVVYVGIENPLSISVPGMSPQDIKVSANNGKITRVSNGWSLKPSKAGVCYVTVSVVLEDGSVQNLGGKEFRSKLLPKPEAYIRINQTSKYKGNRPISKANLLSAEGVCAELDDADLDVRYQVLGFDLNFYDSMGNAMLRASSSSNFTGEQKDIMRKMGKGKKIYISRVRVKGPDGVEKVLSPIEVVIN